MICDLLKLSIRLSVHTVQVCKPCCLTDKSLHWGKKSSIITVRIMKAYWASGFDTTCSKPKTNRLSLIGLGFLLWNCSVIITGKYLLILFSQNDVPEYNLQLLWLFALRANICIFYKTIQTWNLTGHLLNLNTVNLIHMVGHAHCVRFQGMNSLHLMGQFLLH